MKDLMISERSRSLIIKSFIAICSSRRLALSASRPAGGRKGVVSGKGGDISVTGVQTCALQIYEGLDDQRALALVDHQVLHRHLLEQAVGVVGEPAGGGSEGRRVGKGGRYQCDWSSDVCSSDL